MSTSPLTKLNQLITSLNPYEFTLLSVLLGYIFCDGLNPLQIQSLGNFFENLGQTMLTISSQQEVLRQDNSNTNQEDIIKELKKKISNIDEIVTNLKNINL